MSTTEITGVAGALARILEIRALTRPVADTPLAATAVAGDIANGSVSSSSGTTANPFATALGQAQGAGAGAPVGATQAVAQIPGATEMAAQIDEWIARKNPGSPLEGYGAVFVREGLANGIDPRALAAIARAESGLGSDPGARSINNAFGWGPHRPFASWEENIATVAAGLRSGYLDQGLTTLAQIQAKYAPLGAANDPGNLNSNWLTNTTILYSELGGNPQGSVAVTPGGASSAPPSIT